MTPGMVAICERAASRTKRNLLEGRIQGPKTHHTLVRGDRYFDLPQDIDHTFEAHGVKLLCDQMSLMYLMGTEIDYVEGLHGAGFNTHAAFLRSSKISEELHACSRSICRIREQPLARHLGPHTISRAAGGKCSFLPQREITQNAGPAGGLNARAAAFPAMPRRRADSRRADWCRRAASR